MTAFLTLEERYALYVKKVDNEQIEINRVAAANPENILLNMYTNLVKVPLSVCTHVFLDKMNIPK